MQLKGDFHSSSQYITNYGKSPVPVLERIFSKIEIDPITECWVYSGSCNGRGYGMIFLGKKALGTGEKRKKFYTHRLVYELYNKPIEDDNEICHKCDNPPCCNPDHLFEGTHKDNMQDAYKKDRIHPYSTWTHCGRGHLLPEPNLRGHRVCRECAKILRIKNKNNPKKLRHTCMSCKRRTTACVLFNDQYVCSKCTD